MTYPLQSAEASPSGEEEKTPSARHSAWEAPYMVLLLMMFMATLLFLPWILRSGDVLKTQPLGRLQNVHYIGGIRTDTQIDVSALDAEGINQASSYLLRGVANLPPQSALELRQSATSTQICIQQTDQCWALRGN